MEELFKKFKENSGNVENEQRFRKYIIIAAVKTIKIIDWK